MCSASINLLLVRRTSEKLREELQKTRWIIFELQINITKAKILFAIPAVSQWTTNYFTERYNTLSTSLLKTQDNVIHEEQLCWYFLPLMHLQLSASIRSRLLCYLTCNLQTESSYSFSLPGTWYFYWRVLSGEKQWRWYNITPIKQHLDVWV